VCINIETFIYQEIRGGKKRGRWAGFVVMARRHKQHIFSIKIKIKIRNFSFSFKKKRGTFWGQNSPSHHSSTSLMRGYIYRRGERGPRGQQEGNRRNDTQSCISIKVLWKKIHFFSFLLSG
jgi:hypothetical protein